jgi:hypothetical protein
VTPDLAQRVANILPLGTFVHLLGAAWMISMTGAPRSALVGNSWVYHIILGICRAMQRVWDNTNNLKPEQMAARLSSVTTAHFVYAFVILALSFLCFSMYRTWQLVRARASQEQGLAAYCSSMHLQSTPRSHSQSQPHVQVLKTVKEAFYPAAAGQAADEDGNSQALQGGSTPPLNSVPEFPIAVRSQLLVGPTNYDMRCNPNYAHAFERLEDYKVRRAAIIRQCRPVTRIQPCTSQCTH